MSSKKLTAMIDEEVMREVKARAAMRGMSILLHLYWSDPY